MLEFNLTVNRENINQLQSKELRSSLSKMLDAMAGMHKNQWKYAIQLNNIVVGEYYKPDFDSMTSFAKAIGLDKSSVSRYVSAVRIMVNDITPLTGLTFENIPYSKAGRIASVKDVKDFLKVSKIDLVTCTVRDLEKAIKDYKSSLETAKEEPAQEETVKEETVKEENEVMSFTGHYDDSKAWFEINGIQFIIPLDVLTEYKVES